MRAMPLALHGHSHKPRRGHLKSASGYLLTGSTRTSSSKLINLRCFFSCMMEGIKRLHNMLEVPIIVASCNTVNPEIAYPTPRGDHNTSLYRIRSCDVRNCGE